MSRPTMLSVRPGGAPSDIVAENVGEHIRDLIRCDRECGDQAAFERLKAELVHGFSAPESSYQPLTAAEVIARNRT